MRCAAPGGRQGAAWAELSKVGGGVTCAVSICALARLFRAGTPASWWCHHMSVAAGMSKRAVVTSGRGHNGTRDSTLQWVCGVCVYYQAAVGGRRIVEHMCYKRRRAEACVD